MIDEVGCDVCQHVADDLLSRLETSFPKSEFLNKMIENKNVGKKSGRGFYKYSNGKSTGVSSKLPTSVIKTSYIHQNFTDEEIVDRLILIMVNEAVRCLQEKVVSSPKDADFGMIMGTGWAPFRGGPISYLDNLGAEKVVKKLKIIAKKSKYFTPCDMLLEYAENDKKFYGEK